MYVRGSNTTEEERVLMEIQEIINEMRTNAKILDNLNLIHKWAVNNNKEGVSAEWKTNALNDIAWKAQQALEMLGFDINIEAAQWRHDD